MPAPLLRYAPLAAIALSSSAWARGVVVVAPGEDVQRAIDLADTGDTILLKAGTHQGCLTIEKNVQLLGVGAELTTLDCQGNQPDAITVISSGAAASESLVRIGGMTIHNGSSGRALRATAGARVSLGYAELSDLSSDFDGGAILIDTSSLVVATNVAFLGNSTRGSGGAVAVIDGGSFMTLASHFEKNSALGNGGAIFAGGGALDLRSDDYASNEAVRGGAVYADGSSSNTTRIDRGRFDENFAKDAGGAVMVARQTVNISNSWFAENRSSTNGAVVLQSTAYPSVERSLFCKNTADGEGSTGGGLALIDSSNATVRQSLWIDNQAGKAGSAVYEQNATRNISTWSNNTFLINQLFGADVQAGAQAFAGGTATILDSIYWGNLSSSSGARNALSSTSAVSIEYYGSNFFDQGVYRIYDYREDKSRGNSTVDPYLTGWSDDGTCYNDRPIYTSSVVYTWTGSRIGIEGWDGGLTTDWNGDGRSQIEGDRGDVRASPYDADGDDEAYFTDCDDTNPTIRSFVPDIPYDGIDANCDGRSDYDVDGDGWNAFTTDRPDCDDFNPEINPGGSDAWYDGIDTNCDGASDYDADQDGADAETFGGLDCDDADPTVFPGLPECHPFDTDGDGLTDDVEDALGTMVDNADSDGDGLSDTQEVELALAIGYESLNFDDDALIDPLDVDSDNDGLSDGDETMDDGGDDDTWREPWDADFDGYANHLDPDDDGDGMPTVAEGTEDSDRDGTPNYLDLDSDGDGVADQSEGAGDDDGDGVPNAIDDGASGGNTLRPPAFPEVGCDASGGAGSGAAGWLAVGALSLVRRRRPRA